MPDPQNLRLLTEKLADPQFRGAFSTDPSKALSDAGIDENQFSSDQLSVLKQLSPEELRVLGEIASRSGQIGIGGIHPPASEGGLVF